MRATLLLPMLFCLLATPAVAETTPAPLPPGKYECKTGKEYKLRECEVVVREGKTLLILPGDVQHLVSFEAEVRPTSDKKSVYVSVTRLLDARPWGCHSCQERCSVQPDSCACKEIPAEASEICRAQPLHFVLSAAGKDTWRGVMPYRVYGNRYTDGAVTGFDFDVYALEVTIKRKK